ncbi:MAG: TRAP transporter small permease [Dehalococcoidales bacterium]|nr:TRAP transporter small permease [Dehalococcoidales bacterium]
MSIMLLTAVDVCMRYFFNRPISGAFDLTEYLMVVVFAFALPYCTIKKGHISVDILMSRFPERVQAVINLVTAPLSLALFSLLVWQTIIATLMQQETGIVSSVLEIPRYPFIGLLFLGYVCFVIVLLADFFKLVSEVGKK